MDILLISAPFRVFPDSGEKILWKNFCLIPDLCKEKIPDIPVLDAAAAHIKLIQ